LQVCPAAAGHEVYPNEIEAARVKTDCKMFNKTVKSKRWEHKKQNMVS